MMMSDGEVLGMIIGLQNDPDMSLYSTTHKSSLYVYRKSRRITKDTGTSTSMSKPEMQQLMQTMQRYFDCIKV